MLENYDALVLRYLENMESNDLSLNSRESYERTFRLFRDYMAANGISEPTPAALLGFKTQKSRKLTTTALYLTHLRLLSAFGVANGLLPEPFYREDAVQISRKKLSAARTKPYEHVLTEADMVALLTAERPAHGRKSPTWARERAEVAIMIQSGLRNVELRSLRPCDLDFPNGLIAPPSTKGDKPRIVPFPAAAQRAVESYLQSGLRPAWAGPDAPLFGAVAADGRWRGMERTELSKRVLYYTQSVLGKEKACRTHAARHCYASVLLEHGVDMQIISETLGHASTATTRIYAARFDRSAPAAGVSAVLNAVTA